MLLKEEGGHPEAKSFTGDAFDLQEVPLGHEGEVKALQNGRVEWEGKGEETKEVKDKLCSVWATGIQRKEGGSSGMSYGECRPSPWPMPWLRTCGPTAPERTNMGPWVPQAFAGEL